MVGSLWWFERSSPAVVGLHTALSRACGSFLIIVALISGLGVLAADDMPGRIAAAVVAGGVFACGVVVASGRRSLLVLGLLVALSVVAQTAAEPTQAAISGSATYVVLGLALLAPIHLRPLPAVTVVLVAVSTYVVTAPAGTLWVAFDMQALTLGCLAAEIGFVSMLFVCAAETDSLGRRIDRQLSEHLMVAEQVGALSSLRRVVHDDLIGSLVAASHPRASPSAARSQAEEALRRLKTLDLTR